MTGARPYREMLSPREALAELSEHRGTQFDPACVDALAAAHVPAGVPAAAATPLYGPTPVQPKMVEEVRKAS